MKLMIYLSSMKLGGAERVSATLANHWAEQGEEVTVLTLSADSDFYALDPRIRRISLGMQADSNNIFIAIYKNIQRISALRKNLKVIRPDVAIAMITVNNILLAIASVGLGIKTIGSERSYPGGGQIGRFWGSMRKLSYRYLDVIVALTSESKEWLLTNTTAKNVLVVPNSAVWPLPAHEPYLEPKKSRTNTLLTVGRLVNEKGFDLLITAFSKIASKHQNWELVIVGEGPLREQLEVQVKENRLDGQVFLPGRAGNVGDWYQNADLYVLSSRIEGFPNALVEAMSSGLAAVSFDCNTGPRDIISPNINGLLVNANDVDAMAEALDKVMSDDHFRKQLTENASKVRLKFSPEKIISQWDALFAGH